VKTAIGKLSQHQETVKSYFSTSQIKPRFMWVGYSFFILLIAAILYLNSRQKLRAKNVFNQALINLETTQSQLIAEKERAEQG